MPTLKTFTLGCKVNQYETEYVRQGLARLGYREANDGEAVDLCVVNSCTVTGIAASKSRKAIRHFAREHPEAKIVVMDCYATEAADAVAALPGVVEVITDKRQLPKFLARRGLVDVPTGIDSFGTRHRAYVKVQDGCRMQCAYCIIPKVRPDLISRPIDEVLDEIRRLVGNGHREIVLTGIHLGHYGVDLAKQDSDDGKSDLPLLVRRIAELPGEFRVRISSIEAAEATPELLAVMAGCGDRVCPHLHLSMQSGSDTVLARMRRRPVRQFVERCDAARRALDSPALTTDVIVGFPGETDEEFAETCRVVEQIGFSKIHIFRFSPRKGTLAATMGDQIPGKVKHRRSAELATIGERLRREYFESLQGRQLQVLVETPHESHPGLLLGTSARYAPVELPGSEDLIGQIVTVTAGKVAAGRIRAT